VKTDSRPRVPAAEHDRDRVALALSWSGGKDSAFALWTLRNELGREPEVLITTVTEHYDRVSMHGVRRSLLNQQAAATGIPLLEVVIPPECINEVYEARMSQAFASAQLRAVDEIAFGDLFLEDVRAYRESRVAAGGKRAIFPLWHRDTAELARAFVDASFKAAIVCVDPTQLDPRFAGRSYDHHFIDDLPGSVDPCGENGEFHTFVYDGPIFAEPIDVRLGETVIRDGFVFQDLIAREPSIRWRFESGANTWKVSSGSPANVSAKGNRARLQEGGMKAVSNALGQSVRARSSRPVDSGGGPV
jgi:uncharacterized protein (TIGR00290 family)